MIGTATGGSGAGGILNYCYYEKIKLTKEKLAKLGLKDVRGEIVHIQNLGLSRLKDTRFDMQDLAKQFEDCASKNKDLKKYIWHQSFSFPPGEIPSKEQIQEISETFSEDFGFKNNQMVSFRHVDKAHDHFHIVGNRIDYNGKTTASDSNNYKRIGNFCRKMELKLGLTIIPNMFCLQAKNEKTQEKKQHYSQSKLADKLRQTITKYIPISKSFDQFEEYLKNEKIKAYRTRGISFFDQQSKVKFKGSDLGKEFSLMNIEKRLGNQPKKNPTLKEYFAQENTQKKGYSMKR